VSNAFAESRETFGRNHAGLEDEERDGCKNETLDDGLAGTLMCGIWNPALWY